MKRTLPFLVALLATGCIRANVQRLDQSWRPERSPEEVQVLTEVPDEPYTVIAVVEASTDAVFESFDDLRERLIAEAATLGGEAVILGEESKESGMLITATAQIHTERKELAGEVIVFIRGLR